MTYYKPCLNCAADKKQCPVRMRLQSAMKGLHITSVNFKCEEGRCQGYGKFPKSWGSYWPDGCWTAKQKAQEAAA